MILDRFEGRYAICEIDDNTFTQVERSLLPPDAREGDVLRLEKDGRYVIDAEETAMRRARIRSKMDLLFRRGTRKPE